MKRFPEKHRHFLLMFCLVAFNTLVLTAQDTIGIGSGSDIKVSENSTAQLGSWLDEARDSLDNNAFKAASKLASKAFKLAFMLSDQSSRLEAAYIGCRADYYDQAYESSFSFAQSGMDIASQLKNDERMAFFYNMLGILSRRFDECDNAINYYRKALEINYRLSDSLNIARNYNNLAVCHQILGDFSASIDDLGKALEIRKSLKDSLGQANILLNMGNSYEEISNYELAFEKYLQARDLYMLIGRQDMAANSLFNIGLVYHELDNYDKALEYYGDAGEIALNGGLDELEAFVYQNIGNLYGDLGNFEVAINYQKKALSIFQKLSLSGSVSDVLLNIGIHFLALNKKDSSEYYLQACLEQAQLSGATDVFSDVNIELAKLYIEKSEFRKAEKYLDVALKTAVERNDVYLQSQSIKTRYELEKARGRSAEALRNYEEYTVLKDSLNKLDQEQSISKFKLQYDFEKQEAQIALLNKDNQLKVSEIERAKVKSRFMLLALIFLSLGIAGLIFLFDFIRRKNKLISKEKEKSEALLRNILPEETAEELKAKGSVQAKRYESATVLFTDFVNFTNYAEGVTPEDVVKSIDYFFREFDSIVEKYNIEKIKTIGDAYMCAGGIPQPDENSVFNVVSAAKEILEFVQKVKRDKPAGVHPFDIRIGLNTGPIVAGVVGTHKFQFDIWGDAVNIASRMEAACEPGKVNISESTYEKVKSAFEFDYRGELLIKNKGLMKMYYLKT